MMSRQYELIRSAGRPAQKEESMTRVKVAAMVVVIATAPFLAYSWDNDCRYSEPREVVVKTDRAGAIHIKAGAGFLHVRGEQGLDEVQVTGEACAKKKSQLEEVTVDGRVVGGEVRIETHQPRHGNTRLDLTIKVPAEMKVEIDDGSGEIVISDVAGAEIEDGSGEISATRINGDLEVTDGSGEIEVRDLDGDLRISDGSGEIEVRHVTGSVSLNDGSGEIEIERIDGDVKIRSDGSGDISVEQVGGSLHIGSDGSGSIFAEEITGDFIVDRDGSGEIDHRNVGGRVDIPRK
jgi:hypothetical protein